MEHTEEQIKEAIRQLKEREKTAGGSFELALIAERLKQKGKELERLQKAAARNTDNDHTH